MRVAVISDIHGNLHALEAALAVIEDERPDAVWCLGDLVGYGPRPNECCARVAGVADVCLIGNHDLGVLEQISLEEFSHEAAASARWTQGVLDDKARGVPGRPDGRGGDPRGRRGALPREPARPDLGVRPRRQLDGGGPRGHGAAGGDGRAQPRPADGDGRGPAADGSARAGRDRIRLLRPPSPAESGLGRPAAGRRPQRRRSCSSTWPSSVRRSAASSTTSSGRRKRYSTKGCRSRSRSG